MKKIHRQPIVGQPQQEQPPVAQVTQQGINTVQARPTDINIPHSIDKIVKEVKLYRKLYEAEKRLDVFTTRKLNDYQEHLSKNATKKQLLRIFIYNTAENQPWQLQGQASTEQPSWTLRIEGRLVNKEKADDLNRKKFSTFISGLAVDIMPKGQQQQPDPSQPYPQIPKENVIEWHEPTDSNAQRVEFDGLDVKRPGNENLKVKITIQPKDFPIKLRTSQELASLLGVPEVSQHDALYGIWQYIQFNNLQSPEDKRIINCDESLVRLFGVPRFEFKDLLALLAKHLAPKPPISLDYEIKVDRASTLGDLNIDIEVPAENLEEHQIFKAETEKMQLIDESIKELNSKIVLGIQGLQSANRKYQFFEKLSQDPVNFLSDFTKSHAQLLKILSGDEGYNEDNVRRSDFYTDEMLSENVDILLKTNRI